VNRLLNADAINEPAALEEHAPWPCPTSTPPRPRPANHTTIQEETPMSGVLVTTDYLHPGDEVDALLRKHGHQVIDVLDGRQPRHPIDHR
jgi:hypothetical protein